jgi:hypothetical protein
MDGACCVEDWHQAVERVQAGAPLVYVRRPPGERTAVYRDGADRIAAAMWLEAQQGDELPEAIRLAKAPR